MANPEYMHAREIGLRANSIESSACVANGTCCISDVPLTKGDVEIIVEGIRQGQISRDVIYATIDRSRDSKRREKCPFLNSENKCSIYDSRPLICIVWGIGGSPHKFSLEGVQKAEPGRINNSDLIQQACLECHLLTVFNTTSEEANELAQEARLQAEPVLMEGGRKYTTSEFVKRELPFI